MISDSELARWRDLWRSDEPVNAELAERARQAVRRFRLWIYAELLVTVVMGGGALLRAARAQQASVTMLAVWVWISLAAAWLFRFINDWSDLTGAATQTDSFAPVLIRRLRSNLRAAEFGGVLFFVQLFVTSAWVFRQVPVTPTAVLAIASGTVVFVIWLVRHRRRLKREIAELEPAGHDHLLFRVEGDGVFAVGVEVAEKGLLPPAEGEKGHGRGDGHVDADHADFDA